MKNIIFLLVIVITSSCRTAHICSDSITSFNKLEYLIISKELIKKINNQPVYSADILMTFKNQENPLDSGYYPDTLICYALTICKNESLIKANFVTSIDGYSIMKKYNFNRIDFKDIQPNRMSIEDFQLLYKTCFGTLEIKRISRNWEKQLTTNNFSMIGIRKIYFKGDPKFNSKLILK
jgi:hypothetical protein